MFDIHWGLPVIGYLFLAGVGAGAYTVSGSVLLRGGGGGFVGEHFRLARLGALIAPLPMIVGTGLLVLELGSFQHALATGDVASAFKWINLFLTINMSPISIGSWVLALCIIASVVYAYTFLGRNAENGAMDGLRRALAWIGVPLGIAVAVYTGVLLGAMPARPFWNSPVLAMLFLISALSTAVAAILLVRALIQKQQVPMEDEAGGGYLLTASDTLLIGFELLAVFLFVIFAHLTIGNPAQAVSIILPGGALAGMFWLGVVLLGLIVPVLIELRYVIPTLLNHQPYAIPRGVEIVVCTIVLVGGFLLRYVVVMAGQMTGPAGL